jgi:glutamate formiminotransferase
MTATSSIHRVPDRPAAPALLECVPNVSEGRDRRVLDGLARAVRAVPAVTLMDVHADADHHRSVFSFLGDGAAVEAAVLALADAVFAAVDMRRHRGVHPRMGALDVVPLVPLAGTSMATAVAYAHRVGRALAEAHGVPVYFYGHAARREERRRLAAVRRGGYEALAARLLTAVGAPDEGPARADPRRGAVAVGAREVLVAYNVWLDTSDVAVARAIARDIRERDGGLPAVQALGLALPGAGAVQVSMNLVDYRVTPVPAAFDRVRAAAARHGVDVRRAELVGVMPRAALAGRSPESVGLGVLGPERFLDTYLAVPSGGAPPGPIG